MNNSKNAKKMLAGSLIPADKFLRKLLKTYEKNCQLTDSQPCPWLQKNIRRGIQNLKLITEIIFEPLMISPESKGKDQRPILFEPLLTTLKQCQYNVIKDLHIWDYPLSYENMSSLALLVEKPRFPIRILDLMNCLIHTYTLKRLVKAFPSCNYLETINLDHNEIGDEGCECLWEGLQDNKTLTCLSLNYCSLQPISGRYLGYILSTTPVIELYLDGNDLQCEGAVEVVKSCANYAQMKHAEEKTRREQAELEKQREYKQWERVTSDDKSSDNTKKGGKRRKKKKGKKRKKMKVEGPPEIGPWVHKLHMTSNGIDTMGPDRIIATVKCVDSFKNLITYSKCLEELNLEDNLIGELNGQTLLEALQERLEAKLPPLKLKVTPRMNSSTFKELQKLRLSGKRKKKHKKKKM